MARTKLMAKLAARKATTLDQSREARIGVDQADLCENRFNAAIDKFYSDLHIEEEKYSHLEKEAFAMLSDVTFGRKDYYFTFKNIRLACSYSDQNARKDLEQSNLGDLILHIFASEVGDMIPFTWDVKCRMALQRSFLDICRSYVRNVLGQDTCLTTLIHEFDDYETLKRTAFGFCWIGEAEK